MDHNYAKKPIDIENDQHFMSGESEVEEIIGEDREVQDPGREAQEGSAEEAGNVSAAPTMVTTRNTDLTSDQKTFLIMQKGASHKELQERWKQTFSRNPPSRNTVFRILRRAREENSIQSRKFKTGRKRSVVTKEIIQLVKRGIEEESESKPNQVVNRCRNNIWKIKRSSFHNIMKEIGFRPYVVRRRQMISPIDIERRLKFCKIMIEKPDNFYQNLIITDEKQFVLPGHVFNRKNTIIWSKNGEGSPVNWFSQSSVYPVKVLVFAAMCGTGDLFGPYFIEERLTSALYIELLRDEVFPDMRQRLGDRFNQMWFQQDGASPHRTRASIDFLHSVFGERLIALNSGRVGGIDWPAKSPDFSTLDNYGWDAISRELYYCENPPTDLESLKSGLVRAFRDVDRAEIARAVTQDFKVRIRKCLENGGGHFEGTKKKKEEDPVNPTSLNLLPFTYAHIRKPNGEEQLILGPTSYKLLPGETIQVPPSPFIDIPARHCALVRYEDQVQQRIGESFPLFPGEKLVSITKLTEVEGERESNLDFMPSSFPSEPPGIEGPCLVQKSVSVKFIPDGQDKIQDLYQYLSDKKKADLQHDLNIMQEILRLTASLKDPCNLPEIVSGMIEKATSQLAPQLVQRSPRSQVSLQSPRSKRSSSREANENIYKSPGIFPRSPRQTRSQSPCARGKDNIVVDNCFKLLEYPKKNYVYLDDLKSLENGVWLKNTIVNYYAAHLHSVVLPPADREKVFVFPSGFYFHLGRNDGVKIFTENTDIFNKLLLVIPICDRDHWFLIIVVNPGLVTTPEETNNNGEPLLIVLDSLGRDQSASVSIIRKYLAQEWLSQNQDVNCFSEKDMKLIIPQKPQQEDGFNCGIFLLHYLEKILANLPMFLSEKTIHEATGGNWFSKNEINEKRSIIASLVMNHSRREHKRNLKFPTYRWT